MVEELNIIDIENLVFSYEEKPALINVNMSVPRGSVTAVLGPNGAGKSTLFLNLNGVLVPDSGKILIDGEAVRYDKKSLRQLRRRVGIVFQDPNDQLFSSSIWKDVSFGPMNLGLPLDEVKKRVEKALADTGISELADKPTHALSFGQKKRAAIAGVLAMKPDVIILDEPTAGLDPAGVSEILKLLINIKEREGVTVMIATHEIDVVPVYCDRVYVMDAGKVVMEGAPEEIFLQAKKLRSHALRLPRISHLMEILKDFDNFDVDERISTISAARKAIKRIASSEK